MRADRRQKGFTLLESLIAFAIMALALSVLIGGFSDGLRGERAASARLRLVAEAQNRIAAAGTAVPLVPGTLGGERQGLVWSLSIARADGAGRQGTLFDIRAEVTDEAGRSFALATRRMGP